MASLLAKLKPKRRWVQVSLRTVLVLVTLLCVVLGLWIVPAERQRRAVAAMEEFGGRVEYEGYDPKGFLRRWLPKDYFDGVREVHFYRQTEPGLVHENQVTNTGLAHLQGLTGVQGVGLNSTQVTDGGLAHLQRLASLKGLWLNDTQVTDDGLMYLKRLTRLQWLNLFSTQVTDAGVAQLQQVLPNCEINGS
jgi:hypothetical protein